MKRKLLLMLLCAALGLGAAQAEVYRVESEKDVPADWAEKDTLRLTCIDTNRSDAMVVLFVPNRSALSTKVTAGWVKNHMPGAALYFSGDGTVTMLTDGTDWYIWQEPNYVDPQ